MSVDEKMVLEGSRIKVLSQQRQLANASESGVVVDYFRFTFNRAYIPVTRQMPSGSDPQDLARFFAFKFAELLGFVAKNLRLVAERNDPARPAERFICGGG